MTLVHRWLLFAGYCVVVALAQLNVVRALYAHSRADETASHLILIPFVTAGLLFLDRSVIFRSFRTEWRQGIAVGGVGVALLAVATQLGGEFSLITSVAGLGVLWIAGFLALFGRTAARVAMFPLAFLVFMVPIPQVIIDASVQVLKDGSTELTAWLFSATGSTYFRDGYNFTLPRVFIVIADECSGIRSSIALALTSLLAGHSFLRTTWAKVVLMLFVVPLSIIKNGIRIVTLTLLAVHVDTGYIEGQLHHDGGVLFFGLSLLLMMPILGVLRRAEGHSAGQAPADGRITV